MKPETHPAPSKLRRAFTLVEILVVLGVVLLLAALILPVFSRVRNSARTANCASNLRQIHVGIQLYLMDTNGIFPPLEPIAPGCSWVDAIVPYTRSGAVFVCPAKPVERYEPGCGAGERIDDVVRLLNGGYVLNRPSVSRVMSQQRIRFPSNFLLVMDGVSSDTQRIGILKVKVPLTVEEMDGVPLDFRHNGSLNALFADGHVKRMSFDAMREIAHWHMNGERPVYVSGLKPFPNTL